MSDLKKTRSGEERRGLTVAADVVIAVFLMADAYVFFEDDVWVKSSLVQIHRLAAWQLTAISVFLFFSPRGRATLVARTMAGVIAAAQPVGPKG